MIFDLIGEPEMQYPKAIPARTRMLLTVFLFPGFIWLLVSVLEPLATNGWLGPVPARNLEVGFNAGALFYTEVNLEELRTAAVEETERRLTETNSP